MKPSSSGSGSSQTFCLIFPGIVLEYRWTNLYVTALEQQAQLFLTVLSASTCALGLFKLFWGVWLFVNFLP